MCGIVGILTPGKVPNEQLLLGMRDTLTHRGPDDAGIWRENRIAMAHRRLSVIDLSADGHQPMQSAGGRYVLTYNGEIYNFADLRGALAPHDWRGKSDTEVLLEAISRWGLRAALQRCVGMFSIALFDRQNGTLSLARDRLGIKPLYYGWAGDTFTYASELSAIRHGFADQLSVNRNALSGYLRHYYTPAGASIYHGIHKLTPGTIVTLTTEQANERSMPSQSTYWSLENVEPLPTDLSAQEYLDGFLHKARAAVRSRMVADVPLGAFLSGGLDSSLICALMGEASDKPINTFTMGFDDPKFDESPHGAAVARHLGCQHNTHQVSPQDLLDVVDLLPKLLDEPFSDSSLIPTYLVSKQARQQVTVALSGDGGDELFWGYSRYPLWQMLCQRLLGQPQLLRAFAAGVLRQSWLQSMARWLPAKQLFGSKHPLPGRMANLADLLQSKDDMALYRALISLWKQPDAVVIGGTEELSVYNDQYHWTQKLPSWHRVSAMDTVAYLPDDILTKVDRASMAVSLEARVPLLDHHLVEYCFALPEHQIRHPAGTKWLLRQALLKFVPAELIDRPKQGFGVPIDAWLRGPLKEWMQDLLSADRLQQDGYLHAAPIQKLMAEHLSGRADWGPYLWNAAVFQVWLHHGAR